MPPSTPPPASKPKGKFGFLTKKVGPFSAWVWLVMVGGSVLVWYMLRRGSGADNGSPVDLVTGGDGGAYSPQDAAGAGQPSQNAAPVDQLDPALVAQLADLPGQVGEMARAFGTATGAWEDAAGQTASSLQGIQDSLLALTPDDGSYYGTGTASPTVAATLGGPGQKPTQQISPMWGGVIYGKGTGAELAKALRKTGVNPQSWAKKHPLAAAYVGIPQHAPKKPKSVAHPAPKPKPAPKKKAPPKPVAHKVAPPPKKPVARKVAPKPKPKAKPKPVARRR